MCYLYYLYTYFCFCDDLSKANDTYLNNKSTFHTNNRVSIKMRTTIDNNVYAM